MRPEAARKLGRAIWTQRLRTFGPTVLFLLLCVAAGGYLFAPRADRGDPTVSVTQINGTVLEAHRVSGRAAIFIAQVRLDDGKVVTADSTLAAVLLPHERVILSQTQHASGKLSHRVLQVLN